jgi:hypothetical protein
VFDYLLNLAFIRRFLHGNNHRNAFSSSRQLSAAQLDLSALR